MQIRAECLFQLCLKKHSHLFLHQPLDFFLGAAVKNGLDTVNAGDWSTIAGTNGNFGLEEGDYVGLPTDEASWNFSTFTLDEYNTVLEKIRNGEIKVDNTSDDATKPTTSSNITVDYQV